MEACILSYNQIFSIIVSSYSLYIYSEILNCYCCGIVGFCDSDYAVSCDTV